MICFGEPTASVTRELLPGKLTAGTRRQNVHPVSIQSATCDGLGHMRTVKRTNLAGASRVCGNRAVTSRYECCPMSDEQDLNPQRPRMREIWREYAWSFGSLVPAE